MTIARYCIYVIVLITIWNRSVQGAGCPSADIILPCRCLLKAKEYQVWCSHSDLPKVLTGLRSLSQHLHSPIDELILENNYLPSLPGRTFSSLKVLRLMVRQNGLERVSHDWLFGLEDTLMELFIVEPKLRYLPDESLSRLNALEAITIQAKDLKRLPLITSLAKLRYLQIDSAALSELSPRNFKNLPTLEKFHISGSKSLNRLEAGLFEDLPILKFINISFCGINWLHPRTFFSLPMIKELSLVGNIIQDAGMVGRASKDLISLRTIHLNFNKIDRLLKGSFVDIPALQNLHLSFNNIEEIHHGAFHRVPKLKSIHLNNNILRRVHPESFLQPSNSGPEELWMVRNNISHISELKSLLDALPRLVFLDMSFNKLEIIPFGSLRGHPTLEVLKLNHNNLRQIDKESFMAMPALRELALKNNSLTNFNQEPLWNLPSLKGLDISQNFYRRLEPLFLANLPSLRRLDVSANELVTIDPISFSSTPLIEFVNISRNDLQFIHPATFRHLIHLYELDCSHNQLEEFLVELPKAIEFLHLNYNRMKMLPVISGNKLYSLRHLDLSNNFIDRVNPYNFKAFASLRKLFIKRNLIIRIEENAFEGLPKLEILDLSGNKINHVHPNSFRSIYNLLDLNLANNNIETILPGLLQNMPNLSKLDVSGNRLVDFVQGNRNINTKLKVLNISSNFLIKMPDAIPKMKYLKTLDLSHNRMKYLPVGAFSDLENLVDLRISDNYIQELKVGTFNNLKKLRILYVDHNDIINIETNSFQSLPSLEMIKLNRNKLTKIPSYTFNNLTMLQIAELQQNLLKMISNNAFHMVPNLLVLNVSHNHLPSVEDAGLRNVPSLEVLDLSNNILRKIDSNSFRNMEWLVEIKMDSNDICGIFGSPFSDMPRLRVISLRRNKITRISENILNRIRTNLAVFDVDENPLDCDCYARWLQAWAEESLTLGPHCSDGNLLRELQFIPSDCKMKQEVEHFSSNCETDNSPHHTSQIFSKFTNFRNISDGKNNNLAPLPQESEYFYDEYVDYPFNESLTTISNDDVFILDRFLKGNQSSLLVPQKSSHIIPGDTPTMYAAPSTNKTKPDIPKEVPHSPSSSGFTFFGVPLPSLNLNKLLGGQKSTAKKAEKSQVPIADRKVAIMNLPPYTRATTQGNIVRFPVNIPKIETGGFVPMLPGDGGFQPITDPMMIEDSFTEEYHTEISVATQKSSSSSFVPNYEQNIHKITKENSTVLLNEKKVDKQDAQYITVKPASQILPNTSENPSSSTHFSKLEVAANENTSPLISTKSNVTSAPVKFSPNSEKSLVEEVTHTKDLVEEKNKFETTTEGRGLVKKDLESKFQSVVNSKKATSSLPPTLKTLPLSSTQIPDLITQKPKEGELTLDKIANVKNGSKKIEPVGSLSALLVPGGQQPHIRPAGRPKITKVQSPYTTETGILPSRENHVKNIKYSGDTVTLDPEITKLDEVKENWYFANYNKTYSEPYHGVVSKGATNIGSWGYYVVFYIVIGFNLGFRISFFN